MSNIDILWSSLRFSSRDKGKQYGVQRSWWKYPLDNVKERVLELSSIAASAIGEVKR